ncbi:DEAD/DEAH box helicase [Streptomyces sp. NPDC003023]|uniref:DEAD/DEAH box helicase n=1 Tax=Streptomyces sp. NPDC003023 TaxID=3364675 RepID=UPI0036AEAF52
MRPTLAAQALRETTVEYLTTTFALAEPDTQESLTDFLTDPVDGLFRGPYLRLRRPFRPAEDGWQRHLDWWSGPWPYAHQAEAFARLTTKDGHEPQPTLVTTGTGSGKTESFLMPVLDHCRRAKEQGRHGVKAVLLYPMNALAGDQAGRLGGLLEDRRLHDAGVTAGLYIGEASASRGASPYGRVMVDRAEIRRNPPDILITNYKMLDLLLQRQQDASLWRDADLAYIVIDEFHTYDGAQGTDVAMLLRRLAHVVGAAREGRPLGAICPVATSATLGSAGHDTADASGGGDTSGGGPGAASPRAMLDVASRVFGVRFADDAVIGEQQQDTEDFLAPLDVTLDVPTPDELAGLPDPSRTPDGLDAVARAVVGCDTRDRQELGRRLLRHPLTHGLLKSDWVTPRTTTEALTEFDATSPWRTVLVREPEKAAAALARFVALISEARHPDAPAGTERPLLLVETHLWLRSLSRVLRYVAPQPVFSWSDADQAAVTAGDPAAATAGKGAAPAGVPAAVVHAAQTERRLQARRSGRLPAVYCRHCGRSGWAAVCPQRNPAVLEHVPEEIWRRSAAGGPVKGRVRALIAATPARAAEQARAIRDQRTRRARRGAHHDATVLVLDEGGRNLRPLEPDEVLLGDGKIADAPENGVYVLAWFDNTEQEDYSRQDRCPACGEKQGIRFLGAGVAPLASVAVTQLFTGGELPARDEQGDDRRKTLIFNDSVQDAAHRAGFVASRSWKFALRALIHEELVRRVQEDPAAAEDGTPLNELISSLVARTDEEEVLVSVVPPDLHDIDRVKGLLDGRKRVAKGTWELVGERLAFNTLLEFGLASRLGRTLELTRTVAAEVHLPDARAAAKAAKSLYGMLDRQLPLQPVAAGGADGDCDGNGGAADAALPVVLPPEGPALLRHFEGYVRGLLEHIRRAGGIHHTWLDDYIADEGRNRRTLSYARPPGMPAFGPRSETPAFVLSGGQTGRTDFERAATRESWFTDYTMRCLGLDRGDAMAYLGALLPRLADPEVGALARRPLSGAAAGNNGPHGRNDEHGVYGLTPGHVRVLPLTAEQTATAALTCPECGWTQTVPPRRVPVWQGMCCPVKQCKGALTVPSAAAEGRAGRDYRHDYYRRLYTTTGPFSVIAAEHTGALKRKEREAVEKGFRRGVRTDPNVLSCTPTLELGIDIGQLEAVILASLPPSTAGYVQRAGRAGRHTGNAFTVSLADTSPRALYHLAEPRDLIAGPVLPPGCFLSAAELLRRQYTAHVLDLAARGLLEGVQPLPDRANQLIGRGSWLRTTAEAVTGRTDLAASFLRLFEPVAGVPDSGITDQARAELEEFAQTGLATRLRNAERAWESERASLLDRRAMMNAAADDLQDNLEDEAREKRALRRDAAGVSRRLQELVRTGAQTYLVEQGLLPNYTLVEDGVRLEAMLTHRQPDRRPAAADGGVAPEYRRPEPRVYDRPAESALTELAPGNAYYVRGYRHVVDGFDLGPRPKTSREGTGDVTPAVLRTWRVCAECGHVRTENAETDTSACPRCGGRGIGGRTAAFQVIVPTKVTSRDKRDDARIIDDSENRTANTYTTVTAVDIDPGDIEASWRHKNTTFGVDHVRRAVIRRFNLGRTRYGRRNDTLFAGTEVAVTGFTLCPLCGGATDREPGHTPAPDTVSASSMGRPDLAHHRPWCTTRRRARAARPQDRPIVTATEHHTEALRILLPAATLNVPERLASFSAALHLGLAEHYGGDPAHIRSTPATEPDRESGLTRNYLVLYDSLPGGTGYLQRLVERDGAAFRAVLAAAQRALRKCPCKGGPRRACHRCLLGHAPQREYPLIDRDQALWMLDGLLGVDGHSHWDVRREQAGAEMRFADQAESDLERRFVDCLDRWLDLQRDAAAHDHATTPTGSFGKQIRLRRPDGSHIYWELVAQKELDAYRTRPDLLFRPLTDGTDDIGGGGAEPPPIAVYLDGYRWHASARTNRIADDTAKRARLRADGILVWQITWDDVAAWDRALASEAGRDHAPSDQLAPVLAGPDADAAWPPYDTLSEGGPGARARSAWQKAGGSPTEVDELLFAGAVPSLLAFLRAPDLNRWRSLAGLCVRGLLALHRKSELVTAGPAGAVAWIEAAVRGERPPATDGQGLNLLAARDASGLPVTVVADSRAKPVRWSALAVLDDRPEAVHGDRAEHRRRWKAWLCWGNILQFLDPSGTGRADGMLLARTTLDTFDARLLAAVSDGRGLLTAVRDDRPGTGLEPAGHDRDVRDENVRDVGIRGATASEPATDLERAAWDAVLRDLSYVGDPEVDRLARTLAARGDVRPGTAGYEVAGVPQTVELAWPDRKIGIVLAVDAADDAYMVRCAAAGWHVRAPGDWSPDELAALLAGGEDHSNLAEGDRR